MSTELTPAMRRSALIGLLRNPEMWPDDFAWDFGSCESCAIALLHRLLPCCAVSDPSEYTERDLSCALGISPSAALFTFLLANEGYGKFHSDVTSDDVADLLERLHKELAP